MPNDRKGLRRGLYAITDTARLADDTRLLTAVERVLRGGARLLQYRDKSDDRPRRQRQARALHDLCRAYGVPLLINDDVELARQVGAAGVHLGREDEALVAARTRLGEQAIIGVSCYNRLDLALAAVRAGADYVAFGSFFASPTKPDAVPATVDLLRQARRRVPVPLVAIGGITPANGAALVAAGADYLAVIQGVFGLADGYAAAQAYARLYDQASPAG
jgi:thiamine-phosphate pyrophosphorylase